MSEHWFLVNAISAVGETLALDPEESRHAGGSRRLRDGDSVVAFDGAGTIAHGCLAERGRAVCVESIERVGPPLRRIEIASAVPKGDRAATLLDMATQLGMTAFIPLRSRHSVAEGGEKALRRWRRVCVEACKQSRRPWLPTLTAEMAEPVVAVRQAIDGGMRALLADRSGIPVSDALNGDGRASGVRVVVGPEGGFDPAELAAMRDAGAVTVRLGSHVLRIETAVAAACAALAASMSSSTGG